MKMEKHHIHLLLSILILIFIVPTDQTKGEALGKFTFPFNLQDFSAWKNGVVNVNATISCFGDPMASAREMCQSFLHSLLPMPINHRFPMFEMVRCQVPAYISFRHMMISSLSSVFSPQYSYAVSEGEQWSLSVYLSLLHHPYLLNQHVCIIGDGLFGVSHLLPLAAILPSVTHITFLQISSSILSATQPADITQLANLSYTLHVQFHHQIVDATSVSVKVSPCDLVVVHSDLFFSSWTTSSRLTLLRNLFPTQTDAPNHIVWVQTHQSSVETALNPVAALPETDWQLFSPWTKISRFEAVVDSNGFLQKGYRYKDGVKDVSIVYYGHFTGYSHDHTERQTDIEAEAEEISETELVDKDNLVILISFTLRVFAETAFGLAQVLQQQLHYPHVLVPVEVTPETIAALRIVRGPDVYILQIAIGPQDILPLLLPAPGRRMHYIAWHMEQRWSAFFTTMTETYALVLLQSLSIWTFSPLQKSFLQEYLPGNQSHRVHVMPMYSYDPHLLASHPHQQPPAAHDYDLRILIFGSGSHRRNELISQFQAVFTTEFGQSLSAMMSTYIGGWDISIFDETREFHLLQSDLLLNLHTQDVSVLEIHRVQAVLARGVCVLSEPGADPVLAAKYRPAVQFFQQGNVSDAVRVLRDQILFPVSVEGEEHWTAGVDGDRVQYSRRERIKKSLQQCSQRSRALYESLEQDTTALVTAMDEARREMRRQSMTTT